MATERDRPWSSGPGRFVWCALLGVLLWSAPCAGPTGVGLFLGGSLPRARAQSETKRDRNYLAELALLLEGARRLIAFCEGNLDDRELAKFAQPLAERYVEMANHMLPSAKLVVAHPHLLLVVENLERAIDAAAAADGAMYQKRMRIARDELANLEAVIKQLKLRLPESPR